MTKGMKALYIRVMRDSGSSSVLYSANRLDELQPTVGASTMLSTLRSGVQTAWVVQDSPGAISASTAQLPAAVSLLLALLRIFMRTLVLLTIVCGVGMSAQFTVLVTVPPLGMSMLNGLAARTA